MRSDCQFRANCHYWEVSSAVLYFFLSVGFMSTSCHLFTKPNSIFLNQSRSLIFFLPIVLYSSQNCQRTRIVSPCCELSTYTNFLFTQGFEFLFLHLSCSLICHSVVNCQRAKVDLHLSTEILSAWSNLSTSKTQLATTFVHKQWREFEARHCPKTQSVIWKTKLHIYTEPRHWLCILLYAAALPLNWLSEFF